MKKRTAFLMVSLAWCPGLTVALGRVCRRLGRCSAEKRSRWAPIVTKSGWASGEGTFKAIKLRVVDTGVEFDRLVVVFRNGRTVEEWIRDVHPRRR